MTCPAIGVGQSQAKLLLLDIGVINRRSRPSELRPEISIVGMTSYKLEYCQLTLNSAVKYCTINSLSFSGTCMFEARTGFEESNG